MHRLISLPLVHMSFCRFPFPIHLSLEMSHSMTKQNDLHLVKAQISLGIHPVWSEFSLCAEWIAKDPRFQHADIKDSDQTGRMLRLIWVFAERTGHFIGFFHVAAQIPFYAERDTSAIELRLSFPSPREPQSGPVSRRWNILLSTSRCRTTHSVSAATGKRRCTPKWDSSWENLPSK